MLLKLRDTHRVNRNSLVCLLKAAPLHYTLPLLLSFVLAISACSPKPQTLVFQGPTMGTRYTVKVVTDKKDINQAELQQQIDATLVDFNMIMSTYIKDSELSRLNKAPENGWVSVGPSLYYLLDMSKQLSEITDGAFDVTVGPLVNLWGFGPEKTEGQVPDEHTLSAVRARVGHQLFSLDLEKSSIKREADIYLDLSAIAKGYACDVLAGLLSEQGLDDFMVEIGGEIAVKGHNEQGDMWTIGVEKPSLGHEGAVQVIALTDAGLATSGDYRNYKEVEGQRFSHTIDPSTGRPITHNLASVTVVAPTGAEADALATAMNVMGPDKGMAFAEKNGLAIYMLVREAEKFESRNSTAFEKYLLP